MLDPVQDLTECLDRIMAGRPRPAHDPAQLREYLTARGRAMAQGLDLGQISDQDLAELGRLDTLAQHPNVDQDLAPVLAMAADGWHQTLAKRQHEIDHDQGQLHNHARLRATGVDLDQDHARLQALGLDQDHGHSAPEGAYMAPEISDPPTASGRDQGRAARASSQQQETPVRDENFDEIKWYLENVSDPDDEEWKP